MNTPKAVSDYMREMQRRSAKSRWSGMSAAEKSAAMKVLRAKQTQNQDACFAPERQNSATAPIDEN